MFRKILQIWEEFNNVDLTGFKTKSCLLPEIIKLLLKKRSFLAKRCWKSPNTWPLDSHVVMKLGWSCFSINSINLSSGGKWPAATGNGICKIGWMLKIFTWTIFYPLDGLYFAALPLQSYPFPRIAIGREVFQVHRNLSWHMFAYSAWKQRLPEYGCSLEKW